MWDTAGNTLCLTNWSQPFETFWKGRVTSNVPCVIGVVAPEIKDMIGNLSTHSYDQIMQAIDDEPPALSEEEKKELKQQLVGDPER